MAGQRILLIAAFYGIQEIDNTFSLLVQRLQLQIPQRKSRHHGLVMDDAGTSKVPLPC